LTGRKKSQRTTRHPARQASRGPKRHQTRKPAHGEPQVAEGVVSPNRAGFGFARVVGIEGGVFLPPREMTGLVQGDRVSLSLQKDAQNRWVGSVTGIIERGLSAFLGVIERQGHSLAVRAADRRLGLVCTIPHGGSLEATPGDWVIADIKRYPTGDVGGEAWVRKRLDPERPVEMATEAAIARFGLAVEFGEVALREAHRWGQHVDATEAARRVDLRDTPLVTIDGADARDFDDAVYAQVQGDGFRLVVAIADVSHYVRPGTVLDTEALARGTSVYFPNRVLPMLPPALSDHLCSLQPHVDRLCMVADMQISERGSLRGCKVYPAVMRSAARLTYDQAFEVLFKREPGARAKLGALADQLEPLVGVYHSLLKARSRRGALDFDAPEAKFVIGEAERIHGVEFHRRNEAHKLIEECMVMANVAVAKELQHMHVPALYRVHQAPEARKLDLLRATLHILGIELQLSTEGVRTRDLAAIAPRVRDAALRPFVESLVVRSLAQAVYQPENIGHFGLALPDYAHFTSPIRRYPDLQVHRALRVGLGLVPRDAGGDPVTLANMGVELSRLEKRADEADRYVDNFLKCVYLRDRIGQTFEGLITTVVEFGCFVQLLEIGADGLLHMSAMRDDDYVMTRDGGQWQGKRTARRFSPGMRLRVQVVSVNPVEGLVDLELAAS